MSELNTILAFTSVMSGLFVFALTIKKDRMLRLLFKGLAFFMIWEIIAISEAPIEMIIFSIVSTSICFVIYCYVTLKNVTIESLMEKRKPEDQSNWGDLE